MKKAKPYMQKGVAKLPQKGKLFKTVHIQFVGKSESFYSYSSVKNDVEFIWGAEQQAMFEKIKEYLSTPPVLKAPQSRVPF
jgi:hypothetical protein